MPHPSSYREVDSSHEIFKTRKKHVPPPDCAQDHVALMVQPKGSTGPTVLNRRHFSGPMVSPPRARERRRHFPDVITLITLEITL